MDKEKKDFIIQRGVLGIGLPMAFVTSCLMAFQEPGNVFHIESFKFGTFLFGLLLFVPVFAVAGYFWGLIVFKFRKKR